LLNSAASVALELFTARLTSKHMKHPERLSILYFDDEAACLDIFGRMFGDEHEVRTALTLNEARRALDEATFDIVFSDYRMPEIDGSAFLQEVAAVQPGSYRVMLTGAIPVGGVIPELSRGVIHLFLKKPWTREDLRTAFELAEVFKAEPVQSPSSGVSGQQARPQTS
jgi:DNA-binding NtrC family response regulator